MAEHAPNFGDVLQQLLIILHHAALAQWVPDAVRRDEDADRILALAQSLSAEDLQLFYQIGLVGQRDLPLAPDSRGGFEMVMLRMLAFRPAGEGSGSVLAGPAPVRAMASAHPERGPKAALAQAAAATAPERPAPPLRVVRPELETPLSTVPVHPIPTPAPVAASAPEPAPLAEPETPPPVLAGSTDWPSLIRSMRLVAMTGELAKNCVLESLDEAACVLALDPKLGHLRSPSAVANLEKALQNHFRRPLKLSIKLETPGQETPATQMQRQKEERQRAAEIEIEQDGTVRAMKEVFDARVVPGTVKPLD
jgi:DNA polymerase-3 subunit gamma/tau